MERPASAAALAGKSAWKRKQNTKWDDLLCSRQVKLNFIIPWNDSATCFGKCHGSEMSWLMSLSKRGESPSDTAFSVLPAIICLDNQRFQSVHILASAVPSYLSLRSGSTERPLDS